MGGAGNDTLIGNGDDDDPDGREDIPFGGDGNDRLVGGIDTNGIFIGGAGADTIVGHAGGRDFASYFGSATGVTVNLELQTATGGHATGDVISGIEGVVGSAQGDVVIGSDENNVVEGRDGADTLTGNDGNDQLFSEEGDDLIEGGTGNDFLDGGAGNDTVSYSESGAAVVVRLDVQRASGGDAGGGANSDTIRRFENARGSAFGDALTGSGDANSLDGLSGADTLSGLEGDDTLGSGPIKGIHKGTVI